MSSRARHCCAGRLSAPHYFCERTIEQFYTKRRQGGNGDGESIRHLDVFRKRWGLVGQFIANGFAASVCFLVEGVDVGDDTIVVGQNNRRPGARDIALGLLAGDFDVGCRRFRLEKLRAYRRLGVLAGEYFVIVLVFLPVCFARKIKCFHAQFSPHRYIPRPVSFFRLTTATKASSLALLEEAGSSAPESVGRRRVQARD